jgi:hypothetical protein
MSIFSRDSRRRFGVFRRIGESVGISGSEAEFIAIGPLQGQPLAGPDSRQAAQLVVVGFQHVDVVSNVVMHGNKQLLKKMTPETGKRAAAWMAHCLGRPRERGEQSPAFAATYDLLRRYFPLLPEDAGLLEQIQGSLPFPPDQYPHLTRHAIALILGEEAAQRYFDTHGFADQLGGHLELMEVWGFGYRHYFRVIDPHGYAEWAKDKDLPEDLFRLR